MSAGDKIRGVLRELGVEQYDLLWQTSQNGKPHSFTVRVRDVTLNGCTTRAIIRAVRRRFAKAVSG
jgi:hypothetical protein